ncbi:hypothetical protein NPIL_303211 [Nephila pilipes]|uniref:Uncharacterized protein n=1 Tax=Nephila pilipes TaxID=299642 RepID=A0A8X6N9N6_NEPPI|nr:hypothetical protein NPIL_303211 [Nephila pilipes]
MERQVKSTGFPNGKKSRTKSDNGDVHETSEEKAIDPFVGVEASVELILTEFGTGNVTEDADGPTLKSVFVRCGGGPFKRKITSVLREVLIMKYKMWDLPDRHVDIVPL